ncbi:hypothetical protein SY83_18775 [Paenibacillus swuensis]|uniref:ABC transporter permease n=1 Tax=Paenibacillus swuensis TaxID=1178515 RepID=A0A172TMF0_9BACL|nr:hypothetical protein [Paenibacillus swuensis]ANE47997.1 hypothetical protein SY83_18775 [Paenibacillus swuensis]
MWSKALWMKDYKQAKFILWLIPLITFVFMGLQAFSKTHLLDKLTLSHRMNQFREGSFTLHEYVSNPLFLRFSLALSVIIAAVVLIGVERKNTLNDFTFSLPFSRKQIYVTKWLIGASFLLGGLVVNTLLEIAVIASSPFAEYLDWSYYRGETVTIALVMLAVYTFALFIGTLTGGAITQFILTVIFSLFPIGFYFLFLYGVAVHSPDVPGFGSGEGMLDLFSSLSLAMQVFGFQLVNLSIWPVILYTIIFLPLGTSLYITNKVENNGKLLIFPRTAWIFQAGVVFCFALFGGLLMDAAGEGDLNLTLYYIGFVSGGVISYLVLRFLMRRRFRERK